MSSTLVKDCNKCPSRCSAGVYLVNKVNPTIKGDPLPWAIPEKPIERPALTGTRYAPVTRTDYVHITSISPHQTARHLLFEFIPLDNDRYLIRFFSEYGAPGPADPSPRYYRACLYLGKETILKIKVTVAGEGLRSPLQFRLVIQKAFLDEILNYVKEDNMAMAIDSLQRLRVS